MIAALSGCTGSGAEKSDSKIQRIERVQTVEELLQKLKSGFERRMLANPVFFEKDLGYAVPNFPDIKNPEYFLTTRRARILMSEGDLKGKNFIVSSWTLPNGNRVIATEFPTPGCVKIERVKSLFAVYDLRSKPDTAFRHRVSNPPYFYEITWKTGKIEETLFFTVGSRDGCLLSVVASELYE